MAVPEKDQDALSALESISEEEEEEDEDDDDDDDDDTLPCLIDDAMYKTLCVSDMVTCLLGYPPVTFFSNPVTTFLD